MHNSGVSNNLVACFDLVTGETSYTSLRYINTSILQNTILVWINKNNEVKRNTKLPFSTFFSVFTIEGDPIPESGFKEVHPDTPTSVVYFQVLICFFFFIVAFTRTSSSIQFSLYEE